MRAISEAVAALAEIRQKKFQPIPNGWFTATQYSEITGRSLTFARTAMRKLFAAGRLDSRQHPVLDAAGRTNYTTIYKLK